MSSELKPCPFCPDGGNPKHLKIIYHSCESNLVKCMKCEAVTCGYTTEQEAIAAWNQRAEPAYLAGYKDGYAVGKCDSEQDKCNRERLVQIGEAVAKKEPIHFLTGETYVPEHTCKDISKPGVFFRCSECYAIDVTGGTGNYTLEYCPACGARVVGD